jgi:hypothetical protein
MPAASEAALVLTVDCPDCHADVGERCMLRQTKRDTALVARGYHLKRLDMAISRQRQRR